ncbi:MAG: hypothetical protein Q9217_005813 [Psora testacea]
MGISPDELTKKVTTSTHSGPDEDDNHLPSSPSDVPLSGTGALYILCAMAASPVLFQNSGSTISSETALPDYTLVVNSFISDPAMGAVGTENESLLDAVFFLGFYTLHTKPQITPANNGEFNNCLQRLSMLSAKLPSPTLRYHAHRLASTLLHLHPSEDVRLAYVKDTLEHCPYENLKGSAVGWLKDEILAACPDEKPEGENGPNVSIFATPAVIEVLAPYLWPEIQGTPHTAADYNAFQTLQIYYLALLNLLYLLISNTVIANNLHISRFIHDITTTFLVPLMEEASHFEAALLAGDLDYGNEEDGDARIAEMRLLTMNCGQVMEKIK